MKVTDTMIAKLPRMSTQNVAVAGRWENQFSIPFWQVAPVWENCLTTNLMFHPANIRTIPLIGSDFYELGTGAAFDEIKRQADHADHRGDADDFELDFPPFLTAIRDDVGDVAGSIICDWIMTWVEHWYWPFYADRTAQASCLRLAAECNDEERADLNDTTLTVRIITERHRQREQLRNETITRLEASL